MKTAPAITRAEELFSKHRPDELFITRLALYLRHAFVVSRPNLFAMFRPVRADDSLKAAELVDPQIAIARPNAWYIDLAVGDLGELVDHVLPYPLPYICFYRKWQDRLRVYRLEEFLRKASQ